ncbi:MAG: DUF819 family protein [Bacteroidetes bacterium]|nr:DUF819 family protein [Bacteroidota bacterium]
MKTPFFDNDFYVLGVLMFCLGFVFYTSQLSGFWQKFYKIVPALLLCYLLPAIFTSLGLIDESKSQLYFIASRYLLPASLVLLTLSIDLKAIARLGSKALVVFFAGTFGIIIGGPLAILITAAIMPEAVGGAGPDAVWRGLATLAGSWIGGGANQAAMLEIFKYNPDKYGGMVLVDILVANFWMAIILLGIGKDNFLNRFFKADTSAIEALKVRTAKFEQQVARIPNLTDWMLMLTLAFLVVALSHGGANWISSFLENNFEVIRNKQSALSSFGSQFFWLVSLATLIGIGLSFTKFRNLEGAGAGKMGSVFIYFLVATIGMKMDLRMVFDNPGLLLIGFIWIFIHAVVLLVTAKLIKAPYFFVAVGSMANVGGVASAPIVGAAFHPSLTSVGVLLAVLGYAVGTYGAMFCAYLMEVASGIAGV